MRCEDVQERLSAFLDDELDPLGSREIQEHLESCPTCPEALGAMKKPLDIQVTATEGGLDVNVRGSGPMPPQRATFIATPSSIPSLMNSSNSTHDTIPSSIMIGSAPCFFSR